MEMSFKNNVYCKRAVIWIHRCPKNYINEILVKTVTVAYILWLKHKSMYFYIIYMMIWA